MKLRKKLFFFGLKMAEAKWERERGEGRRAGCAVKNQSPLDLSLKLGPSL
jgi:hypothetical protein